MAFNTKGDLKVFLDKESKWVKSSSTLYVADIDVCQAGLHNCFGNSTCKSLGKWLIAGFYTLGEKGFHPNYHIAHLQFRPNLQSNNLHVATSRAPKVNSEDVQYKCMSIKCHNTVTVITLVLLLVQSVITVSLLWCLFDKYTNYCQNYCWTTVVW